MRDRTYKISLAVFCILLFVGLRHAFLGLRASTEALEERRALMTKPLPLEQKNDGGLVLGQTTLTGHAIAPKLANETAKAELGRASWKLFHTIMARFPEKPTEDESNALKTYIHAFQRVYPCGECAEHFGELLKQFPPQVSSRNAAAGWACHVHNEVNKSLKKELFDCNDIGDFYDCGCGDDEKEGEGKKGEKKKKETVEIKGKREKPEMSADAKEKLVANGRDFDEDLLSK